MVKSELRGENVMAKPASVDAKPKIAGMVAGVSGCGLDKDFPPTPRAIKKVMNAGIHDTRSYLNVKKFRQNA